MEGIRMAFYAIATSTNMEINQEELKAMIREVIREELGHFFGKQTKSNVNADETYKKAFDETMAKVARGEMTQQEAGEAISKAYKSSYAPQSVEKLTQQYEQFKQELSNWEKELEPLLGKGESPEELLNRMKSKVEASEKEIKDILELKKLNEEAAKAEAEKRLQQMKAELSKKD